MYSNWLKRLCCSVHPPRLLRWSTSINFMSGCLRYSSRPCPGSGRLSELIMLYRVTCPNKNQRKIQFRFCLSNQYLFLKGLLIKRRIDLHLNFFFQKHLKIRDLFLWELLVTSKTSKVHVQMVNQRIWKMGYWGIIYLYDVDGQLLVLLDWITRV